MSNKLNLRTSGGKRPVFHPEMISMESFTNKIDRLIRTLLNPLGSGEFGVIEQQQQQDLKTSEIKKRKKRMR